MSAIESVLDICQALDRDDVLGAAKISRERLAFDPLKKSISLLSTQVSLSKGRQDVLPYVSLELRAQRKYSDVDVVRQLLTDGFVDRYTGDQLLFQGVLRLLSIALPAEFPYHPNWKIGAGHPLYWEFWPTVDHVVPVARGGQDVRNNWLSCSMLTNVRKSNRTLLECGWEVKPAGDVERWDGLMNWFVNYMAGHPVMEQHQPLKRWLTAARRACT